MQLFFPHNSHLEKMYISDSRFGFRFKCFFTLHAKFLPEIVVFGGYFDWALLGLFLSKTDATKSAETKQKKSNNSSIMFSMLIIENMLICP